MTTTFKDLGISEAGLTQLEQLEFTEPTQIQQDAIPVLLEGKDIVGQSQTGTGKTAAFALPALEIVDANDKAVQALILTPTRELAQQVGEAIQDFYFQRTKNLFFDRIRWSIHRKTNQQITSRSTNCYWILLDESSTYGAQRTSFRPIKTSDFR